MGCSAAESFKGARITGPPPTHTHTQLVCSEAAQNRARSHQYRVVTGALPPSAPPPPLTAADFSASLASVPPSVDKEGLGPHMAWDAAFGTKPNAMSLALFEAAMAQRRAQRAR